MLCKYAGSTGSLPRQPGRRVVEGREYVVPDDVKQLAVPVLAHRVISKGYLHGGQRGAIEALVARLVDEVPVPG